MSKGKHHLRKYAPRLVLVLAIIAVAFFIKKGGAKLYDGAKLVFAAFTGRAVEEGHTIFRENCAECHGLDGHGGKRAPDLTTGQWTHGDRPNDLFRTITEGISGTDMPKSKLSTVETWRVVAYLRSLQPDTSTRVTGDREAGTAVFYGKGACSQCHMVNGQGGRLGPDLSRLGASRSVPFMTESIRDPSRELTQGLAEFAEIPPRLYQAVTVVTKDGQRMTGIAKNEDNFSLHLMDQQEQLHLFFKHELQEVIHEKTSLMPPYTEEMLNAKELDDLLAYLVGLRGRTGTEE